MVAGIWDLVGSTEQGRDGGNRRVAVTTSVSQPQHHQRISTVWRNQCFSCAGDIELTKSYKIVSRTSGLLLILF